MYESVKKRGLSRQATPRKGGHTVENGVIFHKAGESTKDSPASFTCDLSGDKRGGRDGLFLFHQIAQRRDDPAGYRLRRLLVKALPG